MKPLRRTLIAPYVVLLILVCPPFISANPPERLFSEPEFMLFIDVLYNASTVDTLEDHFHHLMTELQDPTSDSSNLTKARASMLLGKHYAVESYCKDTKRAKELLFSALELASTIEVPELKAEALAVQAEAAGSLFLLDQLAYLFTYGLQSSNLTNSAWKTDPQSIRVRILRANQLLYTPGLYGGSLKKAEDMFQLLLLDPSDLAPEELFSIYQGLGIINTRQRQYDTARHYLHLAFDIFPGNRYIPELLDDIPER